MSTSPTTICRRIANAHVPASVRCVCIFHRSQRMRCVVVDSFVRSYARVCVCVYAVNTPRLCVSTTIIGCVERFCRSVRLCVYVRLESIHTHTRPSVRFGIAADVRSPRFGTASASVRPCSAALRVCAPHAEHDVGPMSAACHCPERAGGELSSSSGDDGGGSGSGSGDSAHTGGGSGVVERRQPTQTQAMMMMAGEPRRRKAGRQAGTGTATEASERARDATRKAREHIYVYVRVAELVGWVWLSWVGVCVCAPRTLRHQRTFSTHTPQQSLYARTKCAHVVRDVFVRVV